MITRIEYQSPDQRRTATVLWVRPGLWHVTRRTWLDDRDRLSVGRRLAKTLTKAQAIARQWVSR